MEAKFKAILAKYVKPNDVLVVAVSGGVDSVVLLDLMQKTWPKENIVVAHINHGMRHEANRDEEFVAELAKKDGVKYFAKKFNLKGKSEEVARKARYGFLSQVCQETEAKYVLTAHHLDDQLETIIFNLTRGVGPVEFWGMNVLEGEVLRPLLGFGKEEILRYAKKNNLRWIEDKTNKDLKYSRNLIRHKVIPELKKINPKLLDTIQREVVLGQMAAGELKSLITSAEKKVCQKNKIDLKKFEKLSPFLQKSIIHKMIKAMVGEGEISAQNVQAVFDILSKSGSKKTEIAGFTIEKNYDKIIFSPKASTPKKIVNLRPGNVCSFGRYTLSSGFSAGKSRKNNILLLPEIAYNLRVRAPKTGDRIATRAGTKLLSDIFTDAKVNREDRKTWPVVVAGREIVWVPLLAASKRALSQSKEKVLIIEVKK